MMHFKERFSSHIEEAKGVFIIEKEQILPALHLLKEEDDYSILLDIIGIDYLTCKASHPERFALVYLLRHASFKTHLCLKTYIDKSLATQSVSTLFASANWAEREVWDQFGIHFKHHPNLKRLLNHKEFIGHPLRKDYPITQGQWCHRSDDLMDEMLPRLKKKGMDKGAETLFLNLGPAHPASHGTIRTFVALQGEVIQAAVSEIGYLHRGFEKSCENHTYNQIIPYTDRLNYCSPLINNTAFAHTIEQMLGIEIPDRAKCIRVILCELSRIIDHLVCLAAMLVDMGGLTNYWYLYNPREVAYTLLSKLTGARMTNSFMRVGGMRYDLYEGFEEDLRATILAVEKGMHESLSLIEHNRIFHDRTQNVGIISAKDALNFGWTGPNLRACGVAYDVRVSSPYYGYEHFDFDVAVGSVGDVYDRMMVRFEEIRQSIRILHQAMKALPKGEVCIKNPAITLPTKEDVYGNIEGVMNHFKLIFEGVKVPAKEHYSAIEGGNGELGFYIISDGSGTPYRIKVRPPCFYAMSAYASMIEGSMIADAVLTLGSLNIVAGEMDR